MTGKMYGLCFMSVVQVFLMCHQNLKNKIAPSPKKSRL